MVDRLDTRTNRLAEILASYDNLLIAFSGGVDSSVLLHAAYTALGDRAVALIADSPSLPRRELTLARNVAGLIGARLVEISTDEGEGEAYRANTGDRCFHCKHTLFAAMTEFAAVHAFSTLAFGEITDDQLDDRPGARAARQFKVVAPLVAAGFDKRLVRAYAGAHDLPVADKPASACLASRIPVGTRVTPTRLATVEAAEDDLHNLGLRQVRVRHHGELARVEVGADEFDFALAQATTIERSVLGHGFERVDLAVYRVPGRVAGDDGASGS